MANTFTTIEVIQQIVNDVDSAHASDLEVDCDGQLIVHTGIYRWDDGTYSDEPEPGLLETKFVRREKDLNPHHPADDETHIPSQDDDEHCDMTDTCLCPYHHH